MAKMVAALEAAGVEFTNGRRPGVRLKTPMAKRQAGRGLMGTTICPRDFITEYVDPAITLWRQNQDVKHLAIHAITEIDVLAAVVALWICPEGIREGKFRDELGRREPALAVIRDAHDSHKHGALGRTTATAASQGQRPEPITKYGYFLNHMFLNGPRSRYSYLAYVLNDGTEKRVSIMLDEGMEAWSRELIRLGLR